MTWDQDKVDYFMKSYSWTNSEQKSCPMSTSNTIVPKEMYDSATNVIFQEMKKTICGFICSVIIWGVLNKMQML